LVSWKAFILKDSVVIITSDHGDEFNEHGGLSHFIFDVSGYGQDAWREKGVRAIKRINSAVAS